MSQQWQAPGNGYPSGWDAPDPAGTAGPSPAWGAGAQGGFAGLQAGGAGQFAAAPIGQYDRQPWEPTGTATTNGVGPNRLDNLQSDVAALKIRGGNTRVERQVRIGGAALMAVGVALIVIAWLQASAPNTSVNNQMAYFMSGGLGGIGLIGIGAAVYLRSWIARLRYWQARQVVEYREFTAQVVILLARIEKLLGGSGDLPGNAPGLKPGSLWDSITAPPDAPVPAREEAKQLIGDPFAPSDLAAFGGGPASNGDLFISTGGNAQDSYAATGGNAQDSYAATGGNAQDSYAATGGNAQINGGAAQTWSFSPSAGAAAGTFGAEERGRDLVAAPVAEQAPIYTNEHGHVWDNGVQQWYDPGSHQWFDGIAGQWYRRDAAPPSF